MAVSRKSCRLCLSESEFNVPLFGNFCMRTNMVDKILICLKLVIEETDYCTTICYKCAENVERYYSFIAFVKKSQAKLVKDDYEPRQTINDQLSQINGGRRHVTSFVREQVYDADYTFSFLEVPNEEKKEVKQSSPFFSYFTPPNVLVKKPPTAAGPAWRSPAGNTQKNVPKRDEKYAKRYCKKGDRPRHHSRDLFESQSQDAEEEKSLDWKLTNDDNIINRVREKCFGRSDF